VSAGFEAISGYVVELLRLIVTPVVSPDLSAFTSVRDLTVVVTNNLRCLASYYSSLQHLTGLTEAIHVSAHSKDTLPQILLKNLTSDLTNAATTALANLTRNLHTMPCAAPLNLGVSPVTSSAVYAVRVISSFKDTYDEMGKHSRKTESEGMVRGEICCCYCAPTAASLSRPCCRLSLPPLSRPPFHPPPSPPPLPQNGVVKSIVVALMDNLQKQATSVQETHGHSPSLNSPKAPGRRTSLDLGISANESFASVSSSRSALGGGVNNNINGTAYSSIFSLNNCHYLHHALSPDAARLRRQSIDDVEDEDEPDHAIESSWFQDVSARRAKRA
jgi:hypothetical protein